MKIKPEELMEAPKWQTRDHLPHLMNEYGLSGLFLEIGVQRGVFGSHVRSIWNGQLYVGVDPWVKYLHVLDTQEMHDQYRYDAGVHLDATGKPYKFFRGTAMEFANDPEQPKQFDAIFVDGDHCYEAVIEEIEKFWPMVKPGGLFAAHDWVPDGWHRNGDAVTGFDTEEAAGGGYGHCGKFEVRKAFYECFPVDEFASITSPDTDMGWQSVLFRKRK